jgi:hypothetical protein
MYPDHFTPDPNNPVVMKMWKLQGPKPLVAINGTYRIPYTDAPICFDWTTGSVGPAGGDLKATVTRAPGAITQLNHGDWSINLEAVDGGIVEVDYHVAQVTFEAPASGYEANYRVGMERGSRDWFDNIQRTFFLASRNGQVYSKFTLDFGINDDPNGAMWFRFRGAANVQGSRNWEATIPQ